MNNPKCFDGWQGLGQWDWMARTERVSPLGQCLVPRYLIARPARDAVADLCVAHTPSAYRPRIHGNTTDACRQVERALGRTLTWSAGCLGKFPLNPGDFLNTRLGYRLALGQTVRPTCESFPCALALPSRG
jgi:hypothetical protein